MLELGFEPAKNEISYLVQLSVWNRYDELLPNGSCQPSSSDYLKGPHDGLGIFDRDDEGSMINPRSMLVHGKVSAELYSRRDDVALVSQVLVHLVRLTESTIRLSRFLQQE